MTDSLNILVVSESKQKAKMLTDSLIQANYTVAAELQPTQDVVAMATERYVDMVVAYLEEVNLAFMNQIYNLNQDCPKPVVIFTEKCQSELIKGAVHAGVNAFVVDGFSARRIDSIVELAKARFDEEKQLRDELKQAKSKLQERKLIEKAKGIIMQQKNLKEEQAYQALRKLAMDKNQRVVDIAQDVINVSKLLM